MTDFRIDSHKLNFHPERVAQWRAADTWEKAKEIFPIYVEVSPSGACNHRCTFCAVDYIGYKPLLINNWIMRRMISEMGACGVKSVMFGGEGEPLLHKGMDEAVMAVKNAGMDAAFTTNGTLLDRLETVHDCTWIKVSVNAGTKETYGKIHKSKEGDFDKVWLNIRDAAKRKGHCTLGVQTVLLPENRPEVFLLAHLAKDAGADYLAVKPYSQHKYSITREYEGLKYDGNLHLAEALATLNDASFHVEFRTDAMRQQEEPIHYDKCHATPNFWAYVMASGDVYSCSAYLLDDRFKLGNVNTEGFRDIWQGEKRHRNWDFVRDVLDIHECRLNCRMDKVNRYLDDFGKVEHVNFI